MGSEKQIKKIKRQFKNGEFDIKENLTFYKDNRTAFNLMIRRRVIDRSGNKYFLKEQSNFWNRMTKTHKIISIVLGSIITLLTIAELSFGLLDHLQEYKSHKESTPTQELPLRK